MKFLLTTIFLCSLVASNGTGLWIGQTATGNASGSDASDLMSIATFNSGQSVSPGQTNYLSGIFTSTLNLQGSGSPGSPVTYYFEPNAEFSNSSWAGNIIQSGDANDYVTIDGGSNGIITATANGTGMTYQSNFTAIAMEEASDLTIRNLTISNLYVRTLASSGADENQYGVGILDYYNGNNNFSNVLVTNCVINDCYIGFELEISPACMNVTVSHLTSFRCNWNCSGADDSSSTTLSNYRLEYSHFSGWTNWDDADNNNHHNGLYLFAIHGGWFSNVTMYADDIGPGFGGNEYTGSSGGNTSGCQFLTAVWNVNAFNNIFDESDGTAPADGLLMFEAPTTSGTASHSTNNVFNNTFIGSGPEVYGSGIIFYGGAGSAETSNVWLNNCFSQMVDTIIVNSNAYCTLLCNTNAYYNSQNSVVFSWDAGTSSSDWTLTQWQEQGFDVNSITGNPQLSSGYIPGSGSALINAGINLYPFLTTDYAGTSRPSAGNWTIGAYQNSTSLNNPCPNGLPPLFIELSRK